MDLTEKVRARYKKGGFVLENNIEVTKVEPGYAEGALTVEPRHMNPIGTLHGGCMFALMDSIGGCAAVTRGHLVTTQGSSVNFLRPALLGDRLKAVATEVKAGKTILVYDVAVYNQQDALLAKASFTFFRLEQNFNA